MGEVVRNIGLSLGADICWPICFEEILRRLALSIPVGSETLSFDCSRVTIEPFDLRQPVRYDIVIIGGAIVGGAIASRDYTPVHHDRSAAQASGVSDVFMNILTTNGYVGRFVSDWAGPDATIRKVAIKLGAPNLPGDTMKMCGRVAKVDAASGNVEVEVVAKNAWGDHATGTVTLALPK